uniref:ERCC excision repair 5, endonuclease n=1 Tax=Homo sapiens TaxID=9606 RepID=F2Z2A1_HUMAN
MGVQGLWKLLECSGRQTILVASRNIDLIQDRCTSTPSSTSEIY